MIMVITIREEAEVSNLYGSRQSRDFMFYDLNLTINNPFPIYMDPDRVGTWLI